MFARISRHAFLTVMRNFSNSQAEGEVKIAQLIRQRFPKATDVKVQDTSGGCGAFYEVVVVSEDFKGKSVLEQHKMVNAALGDEIKNLHGVQIRTSVPKL